MCSFPCSEEFGFPVSVQHGSVVFIFPFGNQWVTTNYKQRLVFSPWSFWWVVLSLVGCSPRVCRECRPWCSQPHSHLAVRGTDAQTHEPGASQRHHQNSCGKSRQIWKGKNIFSLVFFLINFSVFCFDRSVKSERLFYDELTSLYFFYSSKRLG